ncbi:MAG: hypothetical protein NVS4B2_29330 [Chloroflexota bacterium]
MRFLNGGVCTPLRTIQTKILPKFLQFYEEFPEFGAWAAIEISTDAFLGWFGLLPLKDREAGHVEVGCRLSKSGWGKGYATEVTCALITKAFTELSAQRVTATTYQDNNALIVSWRN